MGWTLWETLVFALLAGSFGALLDIRSLLRQAQNQKPLARDVP